MKNKVQQIGILLLCITQTCLLFAQDYKNAKLPIEDRVDDLLSRMTLEEKVAQLRIFHANQGVEAGVDGGLELSENVVERLNSVAKDYTFVSHKGFNLTNGERGVPTLKETPDAVLDNMVELASGADLTVLYIGGDEHTAKEAFFNGAIGDRADINPVGRQEELIQRIKALGKPVIVVLKHRRTLSINTIAAQADAMVLRPNKELKAFQKITLAPGETQQVSFTITPSMLKFTGVKMAPVLEAGAFEVMVGTSSAEGLTARFELQD